jgi:DNA ligase-1
VRRFAALYDRIDATTATTVKVAALVAYFRDAPAADAAWAVSFLVGRRPKRLVRAPDLRAWAAAAAAVPTWLFEECYAQAGDLAETRPDRQVGGQRGQAKRRPQALKKATLFPLCQSCP